MSVTICFSNVHSNIMTAGFLILLLSIRTCVGVETVVSMLFLFHAVLTCISQLVRFCIQSITCFSLHLDDFLCFEQNSLKFFCGTLSVLYLFFSMGEKYLEISAGLVVAYFSFTIYWKPWGQQVRVLSNICLVLIETLAIGCSCYLSGMCFALEDFDMQK